MISRRRMISRLLQSASIGLCVIGCGEAFNPLDPNFKGYVILVEGMS